MSSSRLFILTEAAEMIPLVRRILVDVREARARLSSLARQAACAGRGAEQVSLQKTQTEEWRWRLAGALHEAENLGIEITEGIRCEALFPFEHKWTGPKGDGKLRPAYFVYNDSRSTIDEWFFAGWPADRRAVSRGWWTTYRGKQTIFRIPRQSA